MEQEQKLTVAERKTRAQKRIAEIEDLLHGLSYEFVRNEDGTIKEDASGCYIKEYPNCLRNDVILNAVEQMLF